MAGDEGRPPGWGEPPKPEGPAPEPPTAPPPGSSVEDRLRRRISMHVPHRHNPKLQAVLERVNADDDLYGMWLAANVTAIERLGISDHGPVHVKLVMNLAIRLLRLLRQQGVPASVEEDYGMDATDAEVVVTLAALLHDLGMSVHRDGHEEYSLFLANEKLREILPHLYPAAQAAVVRSETLHAIIGHRSDGRPLTLEAGVVRVADALDMAKGRSRIPFEAGSMGIHSVSAAAVEAVEIDTGERKPVRVGIRMSNSAGIFQVDELLRNKLQGSGLEEHLELEAMVEGGEREERLVRRFTL